MLHRLYDAAERLLPPVRSLRKQRWLKQEASEFRERLSGATDLSDRVSIAIGAGPFRAIQKRSEISRLLQLLEEHQPRTLCEIGTSRGGTLALLTTVAMTDARLLSIDLTYAENRERLYPKFARPGQSITCLAGDSHSREMPESVRTWLNGELFDFMLIDGDHSFEGVRQDYEMYSSFVRPGGLIAFHDIVPDYHTRFGAQTPFRTGGVPQFWESLRRSEAGRTREFIDDENQDGFGIGVLSVIER